MGLDTELIKDEDFDVEVDVTLNVGDVLLLATTVITSMELAVEAFAFRAEADGMEEDAMREIATEMVNNFGNVYEKLINSIIPVVSYAIEED